ncbi:MAG: aldo/keto reductase [Bacteroidales bacterium]
MEYRRFGKTNKSISVITLGGMRFIHADDNPREKIPADTLDQCAYSVKKALECGINHIETAYGYGKSEHALGTAINDILKIRRNIYYLMTKGAPKTAAETRSLVELQLKTLKTDYFDFYAWHGINNWERLEMACKKKGPVEELLKLKEEGIIGHVGFSTHAPLDLIITSIESGMFEFVNLHYYYFFRRNYAAIALAQLKDLGVLIISPNDKGGQLFNAPEKLKEFTKPLSPIQWNARFCLGTPAVHTLSFGITEPVQFDEMTGIFPTSIPMNLNDKKILLDLEAQRLNDPYSDYDGYDMVNDLSGINIPEVLRLRKLWKCYDMLEFCRYRYNLFEEHHHWFPGKPAEKSNIEKINMARVPKNIPLKEILLEAHEAFHKKDNKTLRYI